MTDDAPDITLGFAPDKADWRWKFAPEANAILERKDAEKAQQSAPGIPGVAERGAERTAASTDSAPVPNQIFTMRPQLDRGQGSLP